MELFNGTDIDSYIYRLGNLTLLESSKNNEAGRNPFNKKTLIYESSNYKLSNEWINAQNWNPVSINSRQRDMANKAATVWKIKY